MPKDYHVKRLQMLLDHFGKDRGETYVQLHLARHPYVLLPFLSGYDAIAYSFGDRNYRRPRQPSSRYWTTRIPCSLPLSATLLPSKETRPA